MERKYVRRHNYNESVQYFSAVINTPFHNGEAVLKHDIVNKLLKCLFTIKNMTVAKIFSKPIEERHIVHIIQNEDIDMTSKTSMAPSIGYEDSKAYQ